MLRPFTRLSADDSPSRILHQEKVYGLLTEVASKLYCIATER